MKSCETPTVVIQISASSRVQRHQQRQRKGVNRQADWPQTTPLYPKSTDYNTGISAIQDYNVFVLSAYRPDYCGAPNQSLIIQEIIKNEFICPGEAQWRGKPLMFGYLSSSFGNV